MNKGNIPIKTETKISTSRCLFAICFLVYCTSYIARGSFSFVRSTMIEDGAIGYGVAGAVSAAYFIFYALGQLVNGFLGDKLPPFWMVTAGLCVVVIANAMMMLSQPSIAYVLWWGINGYGHSMLWAPIYFLLSNVINQKIRAFALTAISISSPLGKVMSALVSSAALMGGMWQRAFFTVTIILAAALILWVAGYLSLKRNMVTVVRDNDTLGNGNSDNKNNKSLLKILLTSGVAIMLPSMFVHGLFYNGVVELMPTILHEQYLMSASMSAILEIIIPILSIAGVFLANLVYYKFFKQNDMRSAAFLMGMSLAPIAIMLILALCRPERYLFGQYADAIIFVTTYALAYLFQFAFNHIVIVLLPVRLARFSCSSTVSGIANAINYAGSAISTYGMSYALLKLPLWQTVVIWGAVLALAAIFVSAAQGRWLRFAEKTSVDDN